MQNVFRPWNGDHKPWDIFFCVDVESWNPHLPKLNGTSTADLWVMELFNEWKWTHVRSAVEIVSFRWLLKLLKRSLPLQSISKYIWINKWDVTCRAKLDFKMEFVWSRPAFYLASLCTVFYCTHCKISYVQWWVTTETLHWHLSLSLCLSLSRLQVDKAVLYHDW